MLGKSLLRSVYTPLWPMEPFSNRWSSYRRGFWGERAVARALYFRGYRCEAHRWTSKDRSDIDLVMANDQLLLMLEVKLRGAADNDPFADVFDPDRIKRLAGTIGDYLQATHQPFVAFRVHAVVVQPSRDNPRQPTLLIHKDYLNPQVINGWRGNMVSIPNDGLPQRL